MKQFRVLNIVETHMSVTEQKVAVFDLAEIEYLDIDLPSGDVPYTFDSEGDSFILDFNLPLTRGLIQSAQNEEVIELEMSDFTSRVEIIRGYEKLIYHHKSVTLL